MQNNSILILGRHGGMMQNVIVFLNQHGFNQATGVLTNEEIIHQLNTNAFDVLIIGGGVDGGTRQMIKQLIAEKNIKTKTVEHYGNPGSLLKEIKTALQD